MQTMYFNVIAMTHDFSNYELKFYLKKKKKKKNYCISFPWSWLPNEFTLLMPRTWRPRAFHPQGTRAKATSVNPPHFLYIASGSRSVSFKLSFCWWQVYFTSSKIYSPVRLCMRSTNSASSTWNRLRKYQTKSSLASGNASLNIISAYPGKGLVQVWRQCPAEFCQVWKRKGIP